MATIHHTTPLTHTILNKCSTWNIVSIINNYYNHLSIIFFQFLINFPFTIYINICQCSRHWIPTLKFLLVGNRHSASRICGGLPVLSKVERSVSSVVYPPQADFFPLNEIREICVICGSASVSSVVCLSRISDGMFLPHILII